MKNIIVVALLALIVPGAFAQVNLGNKVKDKINQKTNEVINGAGTKNEEPQKEEEAPSENADEASKASPQETKAANKAGAPPADIKLYSKYDFVPGDKIIFEDDVKAETDGEFPSKYQSTYGQGQVAVFGGEKVIQSINGCDFVPQINGNTLPEQYTIEFDAYLTNDAHYLNVYVTDRFNTDPISFTRTGISWKNFNGSVPADLTGGDRWYHCAIAVNKGMLKAYIDHARCININSFSLQASEIVFDMDCRTVGGADCEKFLIKNVRIASGGIDMYKKITTEGKFVTRGILFDVNKAVLKPGSMGTLNEIAKLMKTNPDLKFSIEGHTDSDGDDTANLKLSQQRADAVKKELISLGVGAERLTTKGLGETKPVSKENTQEAKANNRRVEFIKL